MGRDGRSTRSDNRPGIRLDNCHSPCNPTDICHNPKNPLQHHCGVTPFMDCEGDNCDRYGLLDLYSAVSAVNPGIFIVFMSDIHFFEFQWPKDCESPPHKKRGPTPGILNSRLLLGGVHRGYGARRPTKRCFWIEPCYVHFEFYFETHRS